MVATDSTGVLADNRRNPSHDTFADGQPGQEALTHDNQGLGVASSSFPAPGGRLNNTFLMFDVTYTGSLSSATLWLYNLQATGAGTIGVYAVADDSWTEGSVTWNNQPTWPAPSPWNTPLATSAAAAGWMSFDVTSWVTAQHAGDGVASFAVVMESPFGFDVSVFEDREDSFSSGNGPYLYLANVTAVDLVSFTATPINGEILVEWETASERDCSGYNLYRAESPDGISSGAYVQLNDALIPSGGDPIRGGRYSRADGQALTGVRYYYWLEQVSAGAEPMLHGPVSAMLAKVRLYLPLVVHR